MNSYFNIVRTIETIHPVKKKRKHLTEGGCRNRKLARLGNVQGGKNGVQTNRLQMKITILKKTIEAMRQNMIKFQEETNRRLCRLEEERETTR